MKTNCIYIEAVVLFMLSMVPWPGPTIFKISCPKENARIVRKIVQSKWIPVLEKYKVGLPLECPFHPKRDIFGPQELAKQQNRPSQWTCALCGKSFFEERFLDLHFDHRHREHVNLAEDAVCLADYCDIMRCDVLRTQDEKVSYTTHVNTDIDVWREATAYRTELAPSGSRDLAKYNVKDTFSPGKTKQKQKVKLRHCDKSEEPSGASRTNGEASSNEDKSQNSSFNSNSCTGDLVDSSIPASDKQKRIAELQKLKANCKPEELQVVKSKCETLVRDCIAGLLIHLSTKDFKEVEDELNRAVCWYLTCDRYWEDSLSDIKHFPWGLLCVVVMVLSLGICICYYIIWVIFDTDDVSVTSASVTDRSTPSPAHLHRPDTSSQNLDGHQNYGEDYYAATDKENEYIYVTYPPDLKRRLMESCYNRTTRL